MGFIVEAGIIMTDRPTESKIRFCNAPITFYEGRHLPNPAPRTACDIRRHGTYKAAQLWPI